MVAGQEQRNDRSPGALARLFTAHPASLGMNWASHGIGAVKIGASLLGAGAACLLHAVVPGWFTQTAGRTVERLNAQMVARRSAADATKDWPEYEI